MNPVDGGNAFVWSMFVGVLAGLGFQWQDWNPILGFLLGFFGMFAAFTSLAIHEAREAAADTPIPVYVKRIGEYVNACGRYGPGSEQTRAVREKYKDDAEFISLADATDDLKRGLGGSGIDYQPDDEDKPDV